MTFNKIFGWLVATGFAATALLASSGASAEIVPGITDPSLPQFTNSVKIRANRGKWTITGSKDFTFEDSSQLWNGSGSQYKLVAEFDNAGNFVTGSVTLKGAIPDLGITAKNTVLMEAVLTDFGWDGDSVVGFNTTGIICSPDLGVNCTNSESVLLYLDLPFGGDVNARFKNTGVAVTSVPLPAALVLLSSGLGLIGFAGRRKTAA